MRQIGDEEASALDLDAKTVIDQASARVVVQALEVEASLGHGRTKVFVHDTINEAITERASP